MRRLHLLWLAAPLAACERPTCDATTWYADADGDGYGDPESEPVTTAAGECDGPKDHVSNAADCDDGDANKVPEGVWEGSFPADWTDPIDWDALCDACMGHVEGNLDIGLGPEGFWNGADGADHALAFACIQTVGGSLSVTASTTDLDGLESLSTVGGNVNIYSETLSDVNGLSGLSSAGGDLSVQMTTGGGADLSGLSGLFANGTYGQSVAVNVYGGALDFLSDLVVLGGNLRLSGSLDSLVGLSALQEIGGDLRLENLNLNSAAGLGALEQVDVVFVRWVNGLTDFQGWGAFSAATLEISDNPDLTSLSGLESVSVGSLYVYNHPKLTALAQLDDENLGGGVNIAANDALSDLSGLEGLTRVVDGLTLYRNPALVNLDGLEGLTSVGGYLDISGNSSLNDLSALGALTQVGGAVYISGNDTLTSLSGLEGLSEVGDLSVHENHALTDIGGLSNLQDVTGDLYISESYDLQDISGLGALESVGGDVYIGTTEGLLDISGLGKLSQVGGDVNINQNYALEDISGVGSLATVGGRLDLSGNPNLCASVAQDIASGVSVGGTTDTSGNDDGC